MTTAEFNKMYLDCKDYIFNYVNWKLGNIHNAEDVTAKIFTKAHRLIFTDKLEHKFDKDKSAITTWLQNIANSAIIDFYRTDHSYKTQSVSDFVDASGNESFQFIGSETEQADYNIQHNVIKERIKDAFAGLNDKHRKIAELYFLDDLKYTEIAEIVNVPLGSVKGMINRSRTQLQESLKGLYSLRGCKAQTV